MSTNNTVNYKKLLNSKWTALIPKNKEKHFQVIKVNKNELDEQKVDSVIMEAIFTNRKFLLDPNQLNDQNVWALGWL